MHFISKRFLLLTSAFVVSFRLIEYMNHTGFEKEKDILLVVGVLSAQNNSASRDIIRNTWKTLTDRPNMKFYFLIGTDVCPIHPIDRKSELSCEALDLSSDCGKPFIDPIWTPSILTHSENSSKFWVTAFTFRVNFPVIVRGVRIWKEAVTSLDLSRIQLKNARTGKLVTSVPVSVPVKSVKKWNEIEIDPFILPKSFDAELLILPEVNNSQSVQACLEDSTWFNFEGGIEFTSLYGPDRGWVAFDDKSCSAVSLLLELSDLTNFLRDRETRRLQWARDIQTLLVNLKNEAAFEKDIRFLKTLDVYKNIPMKLMRFYEWVWENLDFQFLLKADDDTFIDVTVIEEYLHSVMMRDSERHISSRMWWWGHVRHGLPVDRHGKWQELQYAAPIYPPFPCGGGYVVNKNIVEFLVNNSRWLHPFQGEDTSLGIWLSGTNPISPKEQLCHWTCAKECDRHSCNRGQLSVDEMLSVWQSYQQSRKLC